MLARGKRAVIQRHLGTKAVKMIYAADGAVATKTVPVRDEDRRRFSLTDEEVETLARQAVIIETHYGRPMDIEWAKDGEDGGLYIVQARPETVKAATDKRRITRYKLKRRSPVLVEGRAIGQKIGAGPVRVVFKSEEMHRVRAGDVLVTDMTDPDWEPVMKRAGAIVTNRGGRTCHAAIIARELGIPAVVGCGDAMPELPRSVMLNVGNPERAFQFASLPHAGVGLARLEFVIGNSIGIHPRALLEFESLPPELKKTIAKRIRGYRDPVSFYVDKLSEAIALLGAAFHPERVIVRLSDFKSNEYAHLIGGERYEPKEENPMIGFRGAARYVSEAFAECFALECRAIRRVREEMGLRNVEVMVPFVRTVDEARRVIDALRAQGLERGKDGLKIIMMCEIPSNVILAEEFLKYFDGF